MPGFVDAEDPLVAAVSADEFPDAVARAVAAPVTWTRGLPDDTPTWGLRVEQMATVIERVAGGSRA
ncbi:hypothetical protein [Ornithinimicrobium kibberense]|uniref:hypothetical protein n=1 Tax=Ornithinimicrobium kibberense TaxID=282060 RepID=UPI00360E043F